MYKVTIKENCIGCGACTIIASDVFEMNDEGKAVVITPETENEDVVDAASDCPVAAIEVSE